MCSRLAAVEHQQGTTDRVGQGRAGLNNTETFAQETGGEVGGDDAAGMLPRAWSETMRIKSRSDLIDVTIIAKDEKNAVQKMESARRAPAERQEAFFPGRRAAGMCQDGRSPADGWQMVERQLRSTNPAPPTCLQAGPFPLATTDGMQSVMQSGMQ